jgi:exodeoxyribonuclease V alpha subunit
MTSDRVTLRGELVSFRRRSEDGWGVGVIDMGNLDHVEFTGKTLGAPIGSSVELTGTWIDHPRFGRQFRAMSCTVDRPSSSEGVIAWLASTLPDVGESRARVLLDHFGGVEALWHVIETCHARLCEVDGITTARAAAIHQTYIAHRDERDHQVALRGWGLTDKQIARCMNEWHSLAAVVERIRANPYALAEHVHGFGFMRADEVARAMGIKPDDPQRIEAGLVHTLRVASHDGHCWLWGGQLQRMAADLLRVGMDVVGNNIRNASAHRLIVRRGKRIYSAALETLEAKCSRGMQRLLITQRQRHDTTVSTAVH